MRGQRAKEIEAAGRAAKAEWTAAVEGALLGLIAKGQSFITDDIWDALEDAGAPRVKEPRALGCFISRERRAGRIVAVGLGASKRRGGLTTVWCAPKPAPTLPEPSPEEKLAQVDPHHVMRLLRCAQRDFEAAVFRGTRDSVRKRASRVQELVEVFARVAK